MTPTQTPQESEEGLTHVGEIIGKVVEETAERACERLAEDHPEAA